MSGSHLFQSVLQSAVVPFLLGYPAWAERKKRRLLTLLFAVVIAMTVLDWFVWFDWVQRTGDRTTWSFFFSPAAPFGISMTMVFCLTVAWDSVRKDRAGKANMSGRN